MTNSIEFGIDLGTTNSSIARYRDGEVQIFKNDESLSVTPSVVYIAPTGRMLVGKRAYDTWAQDPENTQAEFKRWMGFSDTRNFPASGRTMSAEELSAEILKSLRADAMRATQEDLSSAVITVPAAFGSLQCEATARAARLAGLGESPLLQEPIAAAIAYGATPASRDQRWMVFDLGGGTLDIAIVSTRNGRLAVLDHQGDNRLGGKDLDRIIAETLLLPTLSQNFDLPSRESDSRAAERIMRALLRRAEEAKIALSTTESATVELFDLGNDRAGKPIQGTVTLNRADLESKIEPVIARCVALAQRAMKGARLGKDDLDRILLVGGPTQMPSVRNALQGAIGAPLDCSLDPMTVVARGAALYAWTLESSHATATAPSTFLKASPTAVKMELSYERASGTIQSPVAGVLPDGSAVREVKIDSEGGVWTSGWIPVTDGVFQVEVMLSERHPLTRFNIQARDQSGRLILITPSEFSIAYMLPMAAPPLPHTIAIELASQSGPARFDAVFQRGSPLPAEARKTYRADQTLRPSDTGTTLPIKFWEIEVSEDPSEKWWAGAVQIAADKVRRPILEGTEIALTIKIDKSRQMTVEVFIPLLNQSFVEGVFIPDPPTVPQLQQQLDTCFARLERIWRVIYEVEREELIPRAREVQLSLEHLAEQVGEHKVRGGDPDADLGPTDAVRRVRMQLVQLEEQLEVDGPSTQARQLRGEARWTDQIVQHHGTDSDKAEMERLRGQVDKCIEMDDMRGIKWVQGQLRDLRGLILDNLPWFWENVLAFLKRPGCRFLNQAEANRWLARAEQAQADRNFPELRNAVCRVWEMQPPDQVELSKQQAAQSGLRSS